MSCWIVTKTHIDALVTGLVDRGLVRCIKHEDCRKTHDLGVACASQDPEQMTALGRLLWRENHRSVNARYGRHSRTPRYSYARHEVSPIVLLKSVRCYIYQSCEAARWEATRANKLMTDLIAHLYDDDIYENTEGYDAAPWGIDAPPAPLQLGTLPPAPSNCACVICQRKREVA